MLSSTLMLVAAISAAAPGAATSSANWEADFCKDRPLGLYCSPQRAWEKVECPSGKRLSCPQGPSEVCQERGFLKQYGFKGGIARCVPNLGVGVLAEFCRRNGPEPGTFCFGDVNRNLRIACPSGMIFKCADKPALVSRKCRQERPNMAVCAVSTETGNGISTIGSNCTSLVVTLTKTKTVTETLSVAQSSSIRETTLTVTDLIVETWTRTVYRTKTRTVVSVPPEESTITLVPTSGDWTTSTMTLDPVSSTRVLLTSATMEEDVVTIVPTSSQLVPRTTTLDAFTTTRMVATSSTVEDEVMTILPTSSWEVTETWTLQPETETVVVATSTSSEVPAVETVTSIVVVTEQEPTATATSTTATAVIPKPTNMEEIEEEEGGGGSGQGIPEKVVCTPGSNQSGEIPSLPGSDYSYLLTHKVTGSEATSVCQPLSANLAAIDSTKEHWYLGSQICEPSWYFSWNGDAYQSECIALYPGGATAVPPGGCTAELPAICKRAVTVEV